MATTPGGTYYAAATEALTDWPATSENLALQLESRLAAKAALADLKVVQAVFGSTAVQAASTSSTYADTGLSATITPTSASNDILVIIAQNGISKQSATTNVRVGLRLLRGATILLAEQPSNWLYTTVIEDNRSHTIIYKDSPATTSATTYKTQFNDINNTGTVRVQSGSTLSSMLLLEVKP